MLDFGDSSHRVDLFDGSDTGEDTIDLDHITSLVSHSASLGILGPEEQPAAVVFDAWNYTPDGIPMKPVEFTAKRSEDAWGMPIATKREKEKKKKKNTVHPGLDVTFDS